jgi:PEP-CTERM motif
MSFNRLPVVAFCFATLFTVSAGRTRAAFVAYNDFASFSAALVDQFVIQETYESEDANTVIPNGGTLNGLTYDFPAGLDGRVDDTFANLGSRGLAAERDGLPGADTFDLFLPGESIAITLPVVTRAFGVFIGTDVEASMAYSVSVAGQGSVPTNRVYDPSVYPPSPFYFVGLISDAPFAQATISATALAGGGYTVDDVTFDVPQEGDANADGVVNIFDVNLVSAHWGESGPIGDANGDGAVDIFDINLISANWSASGSGTQVPEPATLSLLAAGAVLLAVSAGAQALRRRMLAGSASADAETVPSYNGAPTNRVR